LAITGQNYDACLLEKCYTVVTAQRHAVEIPTGILLINSYNYLSYFLRRISEPNRDDGKK
jgi:hypothetical protein